MHPFRFGEARGERVISSFAQWMFQRPWDHYQSLSGGARDAADELLAKIGGLEALNSAIPQRVERRAGQLELVAAQ